MKTSCMTLFLTFTAALALNSQVLVSEHTPASAKGTLIAVIATTNSIYLFSDGRVINPFTGQTNNAWSKVHKINNHVGMLVAGHYLPNLTKDIIFNCQQRGFTSITDIAEITVLVLQETWTNLSRDPVTQDKMKELKAFVFLAGFDSNRKPRLFSFSHSSEPRFKLQETIPFPSSELAVAAMSSSSGISDNPSQEIIQFITFAMRDNPKESALINILYSAFDATKQRLGKKERAIGGETFCAEIDAKNGYRDLSQELRKRQR